MTDPITVCHQDTAPPHPCETRSGLPVARIVHACHERTIDVALAELAIPGLDRQAVEPVLSYCAELRCEAANVTCPGCKRRTEADGIDSLEIGRAHV